MMYKKWMTLAAAGMLAFSCMTAQAQEAPRTISVVGNSEVTAKSDMATIYIAVETSSPNVKAAVRENANAMNDVKTAVIAAGADVHKIETKNYTVYPQISYDTKGNPKTKDYVCVNKMEVKVTQLPKTGNIIDAAVEAGANRIDSVEFSVSNPDKFKDQALIEATKDAARKANVIASALGTHVVGVVSASDDNVSVMPYRVMNYKMASADARMESTSLDPGESKMQGRVTVVFEIA